MSEYCSTSEMAQKWGLSGRRVGLLCAQERIPGAVKIGKIWMIPADAEKPGDPRREKKTPENPFHDLVDVIRAAYISAPRDNPDSVLETVGEDRLRLIHEGALAYARGDFERTKRCFIQNRGDAAAKLCSCEIAIAAAISTGDYPFYTEIEAWLKGIVQAGGEAAPLAEMALTTAYLGAMASNMVADWLKNGDLSALPSVVKPDALYMRTKYFQCVGNHEAMLAAAQTALTFCGSEKGISFPETYLKLMCAAALYTLKRIDEASIYLLDVMQSNLPHGFITPFAELLPLFGGLIESLLEREYPEYHKPVTEQWQRTFKNWLSFHNLFTQDNIADMLPLQEYQIARLAAQGYNDAEIGKKIHLAAGTVKNNVEKVCQMLGVSGRGRRKKLAKYIL